MSRSTKVLSAQAPTNCSLKEFSLIAGYFQDSSPCPLHARGRDPAYDRRDDRSQWKHCEAADGAPSPRVMPPIPAPIMITSIAFESIRCARYPQGSRLDAETHVRMSCSFAHVGYARQPPTGGRASGK